MVVESMSERDIQNEIQKQLSRNETRLFRINCGQSYQGSIVEQTPDRLILSPWYPIKLGATGISDLIGWTSVDQVIEFARDIAVFCAVEVKGPRTRITPEQIAFIDTVRRAGGRAGIARSVEDARLIISGDPHA
jgi:VRR-NUC domain